MFVESVLLFVGVLLTVFSVSMFVDWVFNLFKGEQK